MATLAVIDAQPHVLALVEALVARAGHQVWQSEGRPDGLLIALDAPAEGWGAAVRSWDAYDGPVVGMRLRHGAPPARAAHVELHRPFGAAALALAFDSAVEAHAVSLLPASPAEAVARELDRLAALEGVEARTRAVEEILAAFDRELQARTGA